MKLANVVAAFFSEVWAIDPAALAQYQSILEAHVDGSITAEEVEARASAQGYGGPRQEPPSGVRLLSLHGPILNRASGFQQSCGHASPQAFATAVTAAASDPSVSKIVISVDSPGGTTAGTAAAAAAVRAASKIKPVVAVADDNMASAAYWIASQANEIVVGPSSVVGSVGTLLAHQDRSVAEEKAGRKTTIIRSDPDKALGSPFEPLSDEAKASMQHMVDTISTVMRADIASGRGMTPKAVSDWTAKTYIGEEALSIGMADRIGTLADVLNGGDGGDQVAGDTQALAPEATGEPEGKEVGGSPEGVTGNDGQQGVEGADGHPDPEKAALIARAEAAERAAEEARAQAAELAGQQKSDAASKLAAQAVADGKAFPAQEAFLREQAEANFDFVKAYLDGVPKGSVTPVGAEPLTPKADTSHGAPRDFVGEFLASREQASADFSSPLEAGRMA